MTTFGKRLKQLRKDSNMTQEELGKQLGKSKNNISQYERDIRQADDETKIQLSELFDCSVDYLIGRSLIRNQIPNKEIEGAVILSMQLHQILNQNNILNGDEKISQPQLEWLMEVIDNAIKISKLNPPT